ncbi:MAG: Tll0287-like domain-containing protein [Nitrospira sp.]
MMNGRGFWIGLVLGALSMGFLGQWAPAVASKEGNSPACIPAGAVADYIHGVIQADRTFYTTDVVERMQMRGIVFAAENWRETSRLPLPAQFLLETGRLVSAGRSGLQYRLISNWAINSKNRPISDFERTGLTEVLVNPDQPYTAVTSEGGTPVFQALYADRAVSQSCVGCHNAHPNSPKKDFKTQDVMGGILLTIPLPH